MWDRHTFCLFVYNISVHMLLVHTVCSCIQTVVILVIELSLLKQVCLFPVVTCAIDRSCEFQST